jgi:hypothetical protein
MLFRVSASLAHKCASVRALKMRFMADRNLSALSKVDLRRSQITSVWFILMISIFIRRSRRISQARSTRSLSSIQSIASEGISALAIAEKKASYSSGRSRPMSGRLSNSACSSFGGLIFVVISERFTGSAPE